MIFKRAVSVLWRGRNPDWTGSDAVLVQVEWSWVQTVCLKNFGKKGKVLDGLKVLIVVGLGTRFLQ